MAIGFLNFSILILSTLFSTLNETDTSVSKKELEESLGDLLKGQLKIQTYHVFSSLAVVISYLLNSAFSRNG